jgi:hypothetical protein
MATAEGKIQLALRNFNDTANVFTPGTTLPALLSSYSLEGPARETNVVTKKTTESKPPVSEPPPTPIVKERPPVLPSPPVPIVKEVSPVEDKKPFIVEVIKGSKLDKVKVEGSE